MSDDDELDRRLAALREQRIEPPSADVVRQVHQQRRRRTLALAAASIMAVFGLAGAVAYGLNRAGGDGSGEVASDGAGTTPPTGANPWPPPTEENFDGATTTEPGQVVACPTIPPALADEGVDAEIDVLTDNSGTPYGILTITNTSDAELTLVGLPEGFLRSVEGDVVTTRSGVRAPNRREVVAVGATSKDIPFDISTLPCEQAEVAPDASPVAVIGVERADGTVVERSVGG